MAVAGSSPGVHDADAALLTRLGSVVDVVDPVPAAVVTLGKALFALRDADAALMQVVDSEGLAGAGVRGTVTSRMHFFELADVALDVQLDVGALFFSVVGAVEASPPPVGWSLVLQTAASSYSTAVDPDGRFTLSRIPLGLVRFRLERGDGTAVTTPWLDAR